MREGLGIENVEPVAVGGWGDMHLDGQPMTTETTGQGISGFLADEVRIIVGEDVKPSQPVWRLECFNPVLG